jgi:glycosyltransferase involved in cell wall biosynthesis
MGVSSCLDGKKQLGVLHVALDPATGVLSAIRELALEQVRSGMVVGIGAITTRNFKQYDYGREYDDASQSDLGSWTLDQWESNRRFGVLACLIGGLGFNVVNMWVSKLQQMQRVKKVVVHYHCSFLATLLHARVQNGAISTFHGCPVYLQTLQRPLWRLYYSALLVGMKAMQVVPVAVDASSRDAIESFFPGSIGPAVVHNGIGRYPRLERQKDRDNALVVAHVGILNDSKGWRKTLDGVMLARRRDANVRMIIAGDGPDAGSCEKAAREHPECVSFLGFVSEPRERLLPAVDVLCLPSISEGFPMSILEALSQGVAVLATPVGGMRELIREGYNGMFVERDAGDIAVKLSELDRDREKLARLCRNAPDSVASYGIAITARKYKELYEFVSDRAESQLQRVF